MLDFFFGGWFVAGVGEADFDPVFKVVDGLVGEFRAVLGHAEIFEVVADGFNEEALVGFADDDGGAVFFEEAGAEVECEIAFGFGVRVMAFVAVFDEDGADVLFKEFDVFGCGGV